MPGQRLDTKCQELVQYFEAEKCNGGPLISVNAVQERVANALGISMKTVHNIKQSKENILSTSVLSWQDGDIKSVRKPEGYDGKRFIVVNAGTTNGFLKYASLVFPSKPATSDYHGEMNSETFQRWVTERLIPNLEVPSLIVMDNAPYHSVLLERQPCQSWRKDDIIEWLNSKQNVYETTMNKNELLEIAKHNKKQNVYVIDEIFKKKGHEVLRLPPYHCHFNAIELVWAQAKGYYGKHIGRNGSSDSAVIEMWNESLEVCTPTIWNNCIEHTEKLIKEWYDRKANFDEDEFSFTKNCGSESEDDE